MRRAIYNALRGSLVLALSVITISLSLASITVYVPSAQPEVLYWSGTNCKFDVRVEANGAGNGIRYLIIQIGDETIINESFPQFPLRAVFEDTITFDSTHFPNADLKVRCLAVGWDDSYSSDDHTAPAKNGAVSLNHPDIATQNFGNGNGASAAASWLDNFLSDVVFSAGPWSADDLFNYLSGRNYLYVGTHGTDHSHLAGDGGQVHPAQQGNTSRKAYLESRIAQIGTSAYPPMNTSLIPPVNFFYLESCNCGNGNNSDFITALWPQQWSYIGMDPLENQALLAFNAYVMIPDFKPKANFFFSRVASGVTVYEAMMEMVMAAETEGFEVRDVTGGVTRTMVLSDVALAGDIRTRLTSVYTGTLAQPVGFWRREGSSGPGGFSQ